MKDYLRKNSQWILAIFSIFLMLTFAINQSNKKDPNGYDSKTPIGTLDGKTITKGDAVQAANALTLAKAIYYGGATFDEVAKRLILHLDPHNPDIHLYLILTEAKRYGVGISNEEVNNFFSLLNLNQDNLATLAKRNNTTSDAIRQAVATILTASKFQNLILPTVDPNLPEFQRIVESSTTNVDPSLPELQRFLAQATTLVDAQYVTLDAANPPADTPPPTQAQIDEQFAAYKSLLADSSGTRPAVKGHNFPFGYRFPDRVRIEYLAFNHDAMRKLPAMQPTIDDFTAARRIYDKDPTAYPRTMDPKAIGPSTLPATLTFDEAKAKILDQIIDARIDQTVKQMVDLVETISGRAFKPAVDADGYRVRIDGVPLSDYSQIASEVEAHFGYRPQVVSAMSQQPAGATVAQWLSAEQLRKLSGIGGSAYISQGTRFANFDELAMNVRDLHPDIDLKKIKAIYRQLQLNVEGPTLTDKDHNTYVYRAIDASSEHDPKTVDEVLPQVIDDLRRRSTYERYLALLPQFLEAARQSGLAAAALAHGMPVDQTGPFTAITSHNIGAQLNPVYQPDDSYIPKIGVFPEFCQAVYSQGSSNFMAGQAAARLPQAPATASRPSVASGPATSSQPATAAASQPATQPTMYLAKGHPVGSVASEVRLKLYLFEVTNFDPPNNQGFENSRRVVAGEPQYVKVRPTDERETAIIVHYAPKAYDPKSDIQTIADRLKFIPTTPFDKDAE